MKNYKLLTKDGYSHESYVLHREYPANARPSSHDYTVEELAKAYPDDWKEVPSLDKVKLKKKLIYFHRTSDHPLYVCAHIAVARKLLQGKINTLEEYEAECKKHHIMTYTVTAEKLFK